METMWIIENEGTDKINSIREEREKVEREYQTNIKSRWRKLRRAKSKGGVLSSLSINVRQRNSESNNRDNKWLGEEEYNGRKMERSSTPGKLALLLA